MRSFRVMRALRLGAVLAAAGAASACGPGAIEVDDLYGLWVNESAGEVLAFELAPSLSDPQLNQVAPDFLLYRYPAGTEATAIMGGGFAVGEIAPGDGRPALVQNVVWAADPSLAGASFGNLILALGDDVLVLESASSTTGERAYALATALP